MKRFFGLIFGFCLVFTGFSQLNMTEVGHVNYWQLRQTQLNDIWGYVDETGIEYALVGARNGVSVVSLAEPENPQEVHWHEGDFSIWRDLKTYGNYAYVTTEAESGLLIMDLNPLPSGAITSETYYIGPFGNRWRSAHNLYIDEAGYAYIFGANRGNGGVIILDIHTDPMNPIEVGVFDNWYVHDGFARGNLLYLAHIYEGTISVVDISDRSNPVLLGTANTPSNFAHNIWPSDDNQFVFTTDEVSGAFLAAFDVSDPTNIVEVGRIQSSPGAGVVPHNVHVYQNWLVTSYYTDGVTVHDITRPHNMVEVGNFDTSPLQTIYTQGCWGAYPFLPSGLVLGTDMDEGLFILQPDYKRACYLEGNVKEAGTLNNLPGAKAQIHNHNQHGLSNLDGNYATGIVNPGEYQVTYSKVAYYPQTLTVNLSAGNVTMQDVVLEPIPPFAFKVNVEHALTGAPILNAHVELKAQLITHNDMTNGLGESNFQLFYEETYEVTVGKWGFITTCQSIAIDEATGEITVQLTPGIYDDFTFDFGWTTVNNAEKGLWVRDVPNPTEGFANPGVDAPWDCGTKCWVTGNESYDPNYDQVNNGTVTLISPVFDLTAFTNPHINYWTYYYNFHGPHEPDDTLQIILSNGLTSVRIDYEAYPDSPMREWIPKSIRVEDYLTPTSTMQLFVRISDDYDHRNLTEAAFDNFSVTNTSLAIVEDLLDKLQFSLFPNPALDLVHLNVSHPEKVAFIHVYDASGKRVFTYESFRHVIDVSNWNSGIYFVEIQTLDGLNEVLKLVKQ
jgi:choice-of-anchor B domain-containing protein